jgi:outer membrane protein TolC
MKHSMFHLSSQKLPPAKAHSPERLQSHFRLEKYRHRARMLFILSVSNSFGQAIKLQEILAEGKAIFLFSNLNKPRSIALKTASNLSKQITCPHSLYRISILFPATTMWQAAFLPNEGSVLSPSGGIRPENIYTGVFGSVATAMVDWKVFNFGKVKANVNSAKAELTRTQADYENELFQHQVKLTDAYLILLINQKLVEAQHQNLERALVFKRVTDAAVSSGMRPGVDSSLAAAEYAKAKLLLLESQRSEKAQRLRLSELTGELRDSIQVDTMGFYSQLPVTGDQNFSFLANPALRFSQTQIDASQARSMAVRKSSLPSVSLVGAGWGRGSGVSNQNDTYHTDFGSGVKFQVYNYLFGISTRWNLTSIIKVRNDYKSEQFQVERFKQLYQTQKLQLDRQSREAEMQLQLSLEQARLTPVQLSAAQRAFNQAEARYQSGLTDLFTLAQSVNALNRAEIDKFVTNGNVWRALLMKAAAAGDLTLFLNQVAQ